MTHIYTTSSYLKKKVKKKNRVVGVFGLSSFFTPKVGCLYLILTVYFGKNKESPV